MLRVWLIISLISLATAWTPDALAEIYKCTDEDGNVAYRQLPCPIPKAEAEAPAEDPADEETEAEGEPREAVITVSSREPGEPIEDCKKRYRDRIDEIDAEIRRDYSTDLDGEYKARLLVLTRQLRACE